MKELDERILRELDHQRFGVSNYSFVMNKLDNLEKKFEFLNYLTRNRNIMLKPSDIILKVKEYGD